MLLTISAGVPVGDLGYLLHKNPARVHSFDLPFGKAFVFYTECADVHSAAALLLDIDPVELVRGRSRQAPEDSTLSQYVNDRPYAATSFLSVAISRVFGSALGGKSKERQELAEQKLRLSARVTALPCRGGETFLRQMFEPLGYDVNAQHHPLDEQFPEWGEGPYYTVELRGEMRLRDLLSHLYVLIPVLDDDKHYWVGEDEIEKLMQKGENWLATHPFKEAIVARYFRRQRHLVLSALARLADEDDSLEIESSEGPVKNEEAVLEEPLKLWQQRCGSVLSVLRAAGAKRVIDLGCGEGKLIRALLDDRSFEEIVGMDVSHRSLELAASRLRLEQLPPMQSKRVRLFHGSLMYRDPRLGGFDAATVIEVVEHLDSPRLTAFERVLFEHARPGAIVITTPNIEYNVKFPGLAHGNFRHRDHRFEWTRLEFQSWARGVAERFRYSVRFLPVGPEDPAVGSPTQMGVFSR